MASGFWEKGKNPVIPFEERVAIVSAIKYVDQVVPQVDKNKKAAWERYRFDGMFVGSDWKGTPQWNSFEEEGNENLEAIAERLSSFGI